MLFLAGSLLTFAGNWWNAVGLSMVAAAISGLVVVGYLWIDQRNADKLEMLTEFGFEAAFTHRGASIKSEYDRLLAGAQEKIDIMGFGLRALREDYAEHFQAWATRASVRILLADPEPPGGGGGFAVQRDAEEDTTPGTIQRDVHAFGQATAMLASARFAVRLYRSLPTVNIFRVDGRMFFGLYLIGSASRNLPTFQIKEGGVLFKALESHFEKIWNSNEWSRGLPPEWTDTQ